MTSIKIDRKKYSSAKSKATWLDNFFTAQVKESHTVTKTINEKEVTSTVNTIVAHKLFSLATANGLDYPKIREAVENDQHGAVGRARMIIAAGLKRKIAKGETLKDAEGNDVPQDEGFLAYKATLPAIAPAAASAQAA